MSFKQTQLEFIQSLKNPDVDVLNTHIEQRRLNVYRELFFNNILGFLNSGFPVLQSLYNERQWKALARKFFSEHSCRSPYFIDISKEFVEYLSSEYQLAPSDPEFIRELAHYEWLELDVSVRKSNQKVKAWDGRSPITQVKMSELATLVSYHFPVHQISVDFQPAEASELVYLVIYRDSSDEVNFTLVNAVTALLLNTISQHTSADLQTLNQTMISALPQLEVQQISDSLMQVLQQLLQQQILYPAD